jgi:hypothetical protein
MNPARLAACTFSLIPSNRPDGLAAVGGAVAEELQIQQFVLLYPPQGEKGPNRVATVLSKQTLPQQSLADVLNLDQLRSTLRG